MSINMYTVAKRVVWYRTHPNLTAPATHSTIAALFLEWREA
jgi:hypothetical protein